MIKAIKITLLVLVCLCLVGFMIAFIKSGFDFSKMKAELVYDEKYEADGIKTILVDTKSSDINIYESDDEEIKIKIYSDKKDKINVNKTDNEISIVNKQTSQMCFGFCFGNRKIDIYVPKTYEGKFEIKTTSGDIKSDLETSNDYKIKVTSGDIKIDRVNSLSGSATSGDIEIKEISSSINFKTTSGDIEIDMFDVKANSSIKVTSGDVEINQLTGAYVDASAKSGDIKVKNNDRHADYELIIKTTSGDIEVN
ncbi:MAG: DUF4097 family beta strand repeat protein [Bacilli bacterium]|nr:DUF4097 family beta strand repeat protein [Bacilli bacterium]